MKRYILTSLSLLFVFLAVNSCFAEGNNELTGTWEGVIYLADLDIDMEIVLVVAEKNGTVTGRITDDWGYLDCDIIDPKFEQNILTFKAMVESSQSDHQMVLRMRVAGNGMTGQWESLGSYGDWSLVKKEEGEKIDRKEFKTEDLVGAWEGPAAYKRSPASKNILILVLEEREGELFGSFSDQFKNKYDRVSIKSFQENNLVLEIGFTLDNDSYVMELDIEVKDDSHMRGRFKIEKMGRTGIWTAEKKAKECSSGPQ